MIAGRSVVLAVGQRPSFAVPESAEVVVELLLFSQRDSAPGSNSVVVAVVRWWEVVISRGRTLASYHWHVDVAAPLHGVCARQGASGGFSWNGLFLSR